VHDIVSHTRLGFGFDRHGEFSAWLAEDRMYSGLARWALATELHAEHSVLWTTGHLAEHKSTLLPPDLVLASRRLGAGDDPRDQGFEGARVPRETGLGHLPESSRRWTGSRSQHDERRAHAPHANG
jgi:hypothetical protein